MTRTSRRKTDEEVSETFMRLHVRGFVDGELTHGRMEELHTAVYELFGDMARDGFVSEDSAFGKAHFSYVLFKSGDFVSAMAQKENALRERIDWMDEIDVRLEAALVTKEEVESMEFYKQDIDLSSLFKLAEDVQREMDDE